jgi:hypothetical protein
MCAVQSELSTTVYDDTAPVFVTHLGNIFEQRMKRTLGL